MKNNKIEENLLKEFSDMRKKLRVIQKTVNDVLDVIEDGINKIKE